MAGSDSGPGEWLAHSSFLEGLVLTAELKRPCNHTHAQGVPRGCSETGMVLKLAGPCFGPRFGNRSL